MLIAVGLLLIAFISCGSEKRPAMSEKPIVITETKEIKETVRDTVFKVEKDYAFYEAYIECRDGKPHLISPKSVGGNMILPPTGKIDQDGKLKISIETRAKELFHQWKEKYIKETKPEIVYLHIVKTRYIEKPFAWYHKALMWAGGISLLLSAYGLWRKFKP